MFIAFFSGQLMTIVMSSGQTRPANNRSETVVGEKFSDRDAAVQACEDHFSSLKQTLQQKRPENEMLGQSALDWQGNSATPNIPLGIDPYPNPSVYEVVYSIREQSGV